MINLVLNFGTKKQAEIIFYHQNINFATDSYNLSLNLIAKNNFNLIAKRHILIKMEKIIF